MRRAAPGMENESLIQCRGHVLAYCSQISLCFRNFDIDTCNCEARYASRSAAFRESRQRQRSCGWSRREFLVCRLCTNIATSTKDLTSRMTSTTMGSRERCTR